MQHNMWNWEMLVCFAASLRLVGCMRDAAESVCLLAKRHLPRNKKNKKKEEEKETYCTVKQENTPDLNIMVQYQVKQVPLSGIGFFFF